MNLQQHIDSRTVRLRNILAEANAAVLEKQGDAAADLSGLPEAIAGITGGETEVKLQEKDVTPTGKDMKVTPDSGYDGLSEVNIAGDENLKAENIAKGVSIYGLVGTLAGGEGGLALPEEYEGYLAHAKTLYTGTYENIFIAESDEYITVGFIVAGYEVTSYDAATTQFDSMGWFSCNYKKSTQRWTTADYTAAISPGGNFTKHIRYADCYIKYKDMVIFPVGRGCYPATTAIDYSAWNSGVFKETIETGDVISYSVILNSEGRPLRITDPNGRATVIEWGDS